MHQLKKSKGFTLMELLAVIVLLSLLTVVVLFSVKSLNERSHRSYYKSQEDMIILAAKDYYADYRSKLPKEIGAIEQVTLQTLINEKYIDPVYDHKNLDCYYENSHVSVQMVANDEYQYFAFLSCPSYNSEGDDTPPVIEFSPNSKLSKDSIIVTMKITDNQEEGDIRYQYIIRKDGTTDTTTSLDTIYQGPVNITLSEEGTYQIVGYAYDQAGNRGTKTSGEYVVKKSGPNCDEVVITADRPANTWLKGQINVQVRVPDNTAKWTWETKNWVPGEKEPSYSTEQKFVGAIDQNLTFTIDGYQRGRVTIYDEVGNHCAVETETYQLQNAKPKIADFTITSKNKNYHSIDTTLTIKASNLAGLPMEMYISNSSFTSGGSWESYKTTKAWNVGGSLDGGTRTVYLVIRDSLGNSEQIKKTYKVYHECVNTTSSTSIGSCSLKCGGGSQNVTVTTKDKITGKVCKTDTSKQSCNTFSCCSSTNVSYSSWSNCSVSCGNGTQTRTATYTSKYNGQSCGSKVEKRSCNAGSCTRPAIRNNNYQVCPSDMNVPTAAKCATGRYDSFYITNASVSGTVVSFHWRVHANNTTISFSNSCRYRRVCIANASNTCVYNIHDFTVQRGWINTGGNIEGDVRVDVNGWAHGDYKVIVTHYGSCSSSGLPEANRYMSLNNWVLFNIS